MVTLAELSMHINEKKRELRTLEQAWESEMDDEDIDRLRDYIDRLEGELEDRQVEAAHQRQLDRSNLD